MVCCSRLHRRRLLADRHSLPFPWTLHRLWCPSASHHSFPFHSLGRLCQRSPQTSPVSLLRVESTQRKAKGEGGKVGCEQNIIVELAKAEPDRPPGTSGYNPLRTPAAPPKSHKRFPALLVFQQCAQVCALQRKANPWGCARARTHRPMHATPSNTHTHTHTCVHADTSTKMGAPTTPKTTRVRHVRNRPGSDLPLSPRASPQPRARSSATASAHRRHSSRPPL